MSEKITESETQQSVVSDAPELAKPAEKEAYEHLKPTQFKPGASGNPAGKKPGTMNRKTLFKNIMEAAALDIVKKRQAMYLGKAYEPTTIQEQVAAQMVILAMEGDQTAAEMVLNSTFDKLADKTEHSGSIGIGAVLDSLGKRPSDPLPRLKPPGEPCTTKPLPKLKSDKP